MRIGIVNDSQIAIEALRRALMCAPEHEVAWIAYNGAQAVDYCNENAPDLVLMDLFMPVMDGIEATRRIMASAPCPILIVTSTVTSQSTRVFEALRAGALDVVKTPGLSLKCSEGGSAALLKKIEQLEILTRGRDRHPVSIRRQEKEPPPPCVHSPLLAIGASTGGPQAIAEILSHIPASLPVSIVVIQHMDPEFIPGLVRWLNLQIRLPVQLAQNGMRPAEGGVILADSQGHLVLTPECTFQYVPPGKDNSYVPSVDIFFKSVAEHWRKDAIGILLTGMGKDGAQGLLALRQKGWHTIAQDEATSAIYGMPKAAAKLSAAKEILPLQSIGPTLVKLIKRNNGYERPNTVSL